MPFAMSMEMIKKIVKFINGKIEENKTLDKNIQQENEIFFKSLLQVHDKLELMIDKLTSYQEISPTTEEVSDLKTRCEKLYLSIKSINELILHITKQHHKLQSKRNLYKEKWYLCVECYGKAEYLEDIQNLNKEIDTKIEILDREYENLQTLMALYQQQIENLKFKFLPLRRLWISNKWDCDANQSNQRVTIASLIQEIQAKENTLSLKLHHHHYENMKIFLTKIIEVDKTKRQIDAIGLGRSCGTYFLNSSLMASLTNTPSLELKWNDLSDMVIYFSINPFEKSTDDRITQQIIDKYNNMRKDTNSFIILEKNKQLTDLKDQLTKQSSEITNMIDINIEKNINEICKLDEKFRMHRVYIVKDDKKYIVCYKHQSNHPTVYYETVMEGKMGSIELALMDENYNNYHGYACMFLKKEFEGNSYFYIPPIIWHKGTGHEYSLHYNKDKDMWYLARFNYDTGYNFSAIFIHNSQNNYSLLNKRGAKNKMDCNFSIVINWQ